MVETQKGAIEVDIFEDGVTERCLVEPGTTVPVGTPLALIGDGPATVKTAVPLAPTAPELVAPPVMSALVVPKPAGSGTRARRPPDVWCASGASRLAG